MDWGSVFNSVVEFMIWFVGCLHVVGCLGGLAFFFWGISFGFKKSKVSETECGCDSCVNRDSCPAAFTGLCIPASILNRRSCSMTNEFYLECVRIIAIANEAGWLVTWAGNQIILTMPGVKKEDRP